MRIPGLLSSTALLIALSACSSVPAHHPVPATEASQAVVNGFPADIHFWADESPSFADSIIKERLQ